MANSGQASSPREEPCFEKTIRVLREIGAEKRAGPLAYAGYGRLHKRLGNIVKAREYLIRAYEIFDRLGPLIEPDKIRAESADLSGSFPPSPI